MGISSERRAQIEQTLLRLREIDAPLPFKLDILKKVVAEVFPYPHKLRPDTDTSEQKAAENVSNLISAILVTLPLFEDVPSTKAPTDVTHQIESEVRQSLNEKFTRSPAFMFLLAIVGVGVTIFSYGLYSFNSDVKRADQVTKQFESQLNEADAKMLATERDLRKRLNGEIDSTVVKINEMQSNSIKALSSDLEKRINEVDSSKRDAIQRISTQMVDFQREKSEAVESVKGQAGKLEPQLTEATKQGVATIQAKTQAKVDEFNRKADQTVAELGKPAIKMVLRRSYYFIVGSFILSIISLLVSAAAVVYGRAR